MDLLTRFEESLRNERLICPGDKVFVACSGGPDSAALFYLLHSLEKKWNLKLGLLHFNHGLRGKASRRDELFVKKSAAKEGVPFFRAKGNVKSFRRKARLSLEEAAREVRYRFFEKVSAERRIPKIALAHTQDDQAETVLMRVLQGTGLRGLLGIRPSMRVGKVTLVRPLLSFSKRELLAFLREKKIAFCKDETNLRMNFLRNRIRSKLMPRLRREFNPRVVQALARIPEILREENALLSSLEEAAWKKVVKSVRPARLNLRREVFLKFPSALRFRVLERALKRLDPGSGLSFEAWKKLEPQLFKKRTRTTLPKALDLSLTPSKMVICKK